MSSWWRNHLAEEPSALAWGLLVIRSWGGRLRLLFVSPDALSNSTHISDYAAIVSPDRILSQVDSWRWRYLNGRH
jgi:hypothetical protein